MSSFGLGIKPLSMEVNLTTTGNFVATIRRKTGDWDDDTTIVIEFDDGTSWPATVVDDTAVWNVPTSDVGDLIDANPNEAKLVITAAGTPVVRGSGQIYVDTSATVGLLLGNGTVLDEAGQIIAVPVPGVPGQDGTDGAPGAKGDKGDTGDPGTTDYNALQNKPALVPVATSGSAADLTSGILDPARLPALAITSVTVVGSQAAMLALDVQQGDVAIRSDFTPNKAFILAGSPATTLANWKDITATDLVQSVAGQNGNISASALATALDAALAAMFSNGSAIDLAVAAKIADAIAAGDFATAAQLSAGLALKANATDVYTKTAADTLLGAKADLVGGLVPTSQIPGVALTTGQAVANRAAMLALTNVQEGDIVSITATSDKGTYLLGSGSRSLFASWLPLSTPTDVVTSVQGQQGVVIIGKADIGLTNVDNTSDVNKPVSTAAQAALDAKAEDAVVTTFGTGGNQAYAIPVGAKTLDVFVLGGGGGGGSGRRGAAGTIRCGGGSGSSGGYTKERINVAELTAAGITTLYLDVGVGGDGGAGQASDNTDGNNGTAGVGTYLKRSNAAPTVANIVIWANSGNPGNGGTATAGTGGSAGNGSQFFGVAGVAASAAGLVGLGGTAGSGGLPGSGASGGGLTAANAASNGGSGGGSAGRIPASGSSVGIAPGGNGGDAPTPVITGVGNGGGGGASHSAGAGGRGGNAVSGGGGGGGGASVNGSLSGAGGNGGNGLAQITANF